MAVTDVDAKYKMLSLLFNSKAKTKSKTNLFAELSGTISPGGTSASNAVSSGFFQTSRGSVSILQMTVQKMHAAINAPIGASNAPLSYIGDQLAADAAAPVQPAAGSAQLTPAGAEAAPTASTETAAAPDPAAKQAATNRRQADSIVNQLGYPPGNAWAIYSMAEDLAVFGRDMTALRESPEELAGGIRTRAQEMLAELDEHYAGGGSEGDYIKERNRITGAAARLANGLEGARPVIDATAMASASASASWSITLGAAVPAPAPATIKVDGVSLDAGVVVSVSNVIVDPLVLDLAGDGINLTSAEDGVDFDMDADGTARRTAFVQGDDAFLAIDNRGDGRVHDGSQLFGNHDGHANGFASLARHDDNADGRIDAADAVYDKLMLWRELNGNGVSDAGETISLREAGIASIDLGYENGREDDGKGNLISQKGAFTRTDGTRGLAADVWLREAGDA